MVADINDCHGATPAQTQPTTWPERLPHTVENLRKAANCVIFLDGAEEPAADVASRLRWAADEIERLNALLPPPVMKAPDLKDAACEASFGYPSAVNSHPCKWPECELTCEGRKHRLSLGVATMKAPETEGDERERLAKLLYESWGNKWPAPPESSSWGDADTIIAAGYSRSLPPAVPTDAELEEIERWCDSPIDYVGASNDELRRLFVKGSNYCEKLLRRLKAQDKAPAVTMPTKRVSADEYDYDCHKCFDAIVAAHPNDWIFPRFIVCPTCGNKRCPKATDHDLQCTGSNESGQPGSAYK